MRRWVSLSGPTLHHRTPLLRTPYHHCCLPQRVTREWLGWGGGSRSLLCYRGHAKPCTFSLLPMDLFGAECDTKDVLMVPVLILPIVMQYFHSQYSSRTMLSGPKYSGAKCIHKNKSNVISLSTALTLICNMKFSTSWSERWP